MNQTGKEGKIRLIENLNEIGRNYLEEIYTREAKGTPLSATSANESSKNSLMNAMKIEKGSKSGSKKKPSSGKKQESLL